jgi:hypothetical protein
LPGVWWWLRVRRPSAVGLQAARCCKQRDTGAVILAGGCCGRGVNGGAVGRCPSGTACTPPELAAEAACAAVLAGNLCLHLRRLMARRPSAAAVLVSESDVPMGGVRCVAAAHAFQ